MTTRPPRPPSSAALALVSFVVTAALIAGPQLAHRWGPATKLVAAARR